MTKRSIMSYKTEAGLPFCFSFGKHYTYILKIQASVLSTVGDNLKAYTIERWFLRNSYCCICYLSQKLVITNTSFLKIHSKFLLG